MLLPCCCHACTMKLLPCPCYVLAMVLSCHWHVPAMFLPCSCCVLARLSPCSYHALASSCLALAMMFSPFCWRVLFIVMSFPLSCQVLAMLCFCHGLAMILPWSPTHCPCVTCASPCWYGQVKASVWPHSCIVIHVMAVLFPCSCHALSRPWPCHCHIMGMPLPCEFSVTALMFLCCCHVDTMLSPLCLLVLTIQHL